MELESHEPQKMKDGYGAIYHRLYNINIPAPLGQVQKAMQDLQTDPNRFSPQILARFEKVQGQERDLQKQDEFQIHIRGPWNGPVRVEEVHKNEFRLGTLEGHLEAGEINFRIRALNEQETLFEIESLARSRDAIVDFVYDKIPIAKAAQTEMWCSFCKKFAAHALSCCGKESDIGEVTVITERRDEKTGQWEKI